MLRNKVTDEEIAEVVSKWTGIPVARMLEGEREKLLLMEEALHRGVVGQDEAIKAVSDGIRRSRAGIQIEYLRRRLANRDIELQIGEAALDHLGQAGFDPVYGA